jgi:hypothetical protein
MTRLRRTYLGMTWNPNEPAGLTFYQHLAAELLAELPEEARSLAAQALSLDEAALRRWMQGEAGISVMPVRAK